MTDTRSPYARRSITVKEIPWGWMPSLVFADSLPFATLLLTLMTLRRFGLGNADITFYIAVICLPIVLRPWLRLMTKRILASPKTWIVATELIGATSLWATGYTLQSNVWMACAIAFLTLGAIAATLHSVILRDHYIGRSGGSRPGVVFRLSRTFQALALMSGAGVLTMMGGNLEVMRRNIPYSWASVFYLLAALTAVCCVYHLFALPQNTEQKMEKQPAMCTSDNSAAGICVFLLTTAECLFACIGLLFLIDAAHNGGQGLSPQEFGLAVGTTGVAACAAGTIGTDLLLRKRGRIGKMGMFTAASVIECLLFLLMTTCTPMSLTSIIVCMVCIEICHGTSQVVRLTIQRRHSTGEANDTLHIHKTSAALLAAVLALMISGTMEESMGYTAFFATILCVCTAAATATYLLERKENLTTADEGESGE